MNFGYFWQTLFSFCKRENGKLVYCLGILGSMWWFIVWHASVQALQLWCKSRPNWPEDHLACQVEIEKDLWIASPQWTSPEPKWFSSKCAFEFEETCATEPDQTLVVSSLELCNQSLDCARYHHQTKGWHPAVHTWYLAQEVWKTE